MVRAFVDNAWTGWSEARSFNVGPATDCLMVSLPEINIKQGATNIAYPGSFDFGTQNIGGNTDITFTIENIGTGDLTLSGTPIVSITGINANQFSVGQQPLSPIFQSQSAIFVIRFHPTTPGAKTAAISIGNDDSDKNPYDINLLGNGAPIGGLIAYYPFNGNANDESGNGHNGTIHGNPVYSEDKNGNPSGALNFDGIGNYVELPDESSFDLPQITIVAIVKVPDYAKRNPIITKGNNFGSFTVHITSPDGLPYYTYQNSTGNETEGLAYETVGQNQFFHLVSTYDSASLQLRGYLNGVLKHSMTCLSSPLMNNEKVTLGLSPFPAPTPYEFFNGVIDEICIYNRILSASEIQALYSLDTGQVVHYPFSGNANDESGHGLNGIVSGATLTTDRFGVPNRAYNFNGLSNFIEVPDNNALDLTNAITISAWIKPAQLIGYSSYVLVKRDDVATGGGSVYSLDFYPGTVRSLLKYPWPGGGYSTVTATGVTPITVNEWQHIAFTWDGATIVVYYNGSSDGSQAFSYPIKTSESRLEIGLYSGGASSFNGIIDQVRIYGRALSPAEVMALYSLGK